MKKIFAFAFAALLLVSCNMDFYSSDSMTSSQLADNPSSAVYTTDGVYSLFKDYLAYKGESEDYPNGRNQYLRHYFQITELRSDNVTVSGTTSDPFIHPYDFQDVPTEENIYYTWWLAYKAIYGANSNIQAIKPGVTDLNDHLLGENYFLRAFAHFQLVNLFAMPYVYWKAHPETPGIVIRKGMESYGGEIKRSTVGDVYDFIVEDLKEAQKYLTNTAVRSDKGYVSLDAAKALLARVYLNMEMNQECLNICNDLMEHAPAAVTGTYDYEAFPAATFASEETIWCFRTSTTDKFYSTHPQSSIASMYYDDSDLKRFDGDTGWGEHYWSEELIDLFQRYPGDKRFAAYFVQPAPTNDDKLLVSFPIKTKSTNTYCSSGIVHGLTPNADGSIDFTYKGKKFTATPTPNAGGYTEYIVNTPGFVSNSDGGAVQKRVYVRHDGTARQNSGDYVIYFNTKFCGQEGKSNLTSPAMLRWGEVVLNRAEARYKLNDKAGALDDVNIIRRRAGLPADAMFSQANMHGYTDELDVVLDERRMEFCFEGLRYFDLLRNRRGIDRRYVGFHEFTIIPWDDPRIALLIPLDEINTSHIEQNER